MNVVAVNRMIEAMSRYPAAEDHLNGWYQILSMGTFASEEALRDTFGNMKGFNYKFRFPIPETQLLVHTLINFESQVAYIEEIKPGNR